MAFSNGQRVKLKCDLPDGKWPLDQGERGDFVKLHPSRTDQAFVRFDLYGRELWCRSTVSEQPRALVLQARLAELGFLLCNIARSPAFIFNFNLNNLL
jgi:hypothetical protein